MSFDNTPALSSSDPSKKLRAERPINVLLAVALIFTSVAFAWSGWKQHQLTIIATVQDDLLEHYADDLRRALNVIAGYRERCPIPSPEKSNGKAQDKRI